MRLGWLLLIAFLASAEAEAEETLALGRAISHRSIDVELDCPKDLLCMDAWYRWEVMVNRVVIGPSITGRVIAARIQHSDYNRRYFRSLRLFVLQPIEDPRKRDELGADYYLLEVSPKHHMYCIRQNPSEFGHQPESLYVRTQTDYVRYCFELPEKGG
jgi:hypothetical protein